MSGETSLLAAGRVPIARRKRNVLVLALPVLGVLLIAVAMRFWMLDKIGFNSDEAVYTGTAASIAGNTSMMSMFPIFRAHPVLFQMLLSLVVRDGVSDFAARALPAGIGVLTVIVTFFLGKRLYGRPAGLIGALILAVMTYHVVVSRQVLLDGLMTLCATGVLYCVVRYSETVALRWLIAASALLAASILAKETSVVLVGGLFAHFALSPGLRLKLRHLLIAGAITVAVVLAFPLALVVSGRANTGQNYLLWQLFRPSNHPLTFYFTVVPPAIGYLVLVAAIGGLVAFRHERTWRERLLICWIVVPVVFFTLWPVKGYQYLLPIAPTFAVLAGRALARISTLGFLMSRRRWGAVVRTVSVSAVVISLIVPSWNQVVSPSKSLVLAGSGGIAGGREAGRWIVGNVPEGARILTIGPSMANILQFYGLHKAQSLSVSPNPQSRNPSYTPVNNADYAVRSGEFQFLVWDSYTAARTSFFANKLNTLVTRYHGVLVYPTATDSLDAAPVRIFQVRAP